MKFNKFLYFFAVLTFLTVSSFSLTAFTQTVANAPDDSMRQVPGNSVEGFWVLNINESDDIKQIIETLVQQSFENSDKVITDEKTEIPGISISILPPENLVIIGGANEMTINEFFADIVSTRTVKTDGQMHAYYANNGVAVVANAKATRNDLSIETLSPRGNHRLETFNLSADGKKLNVTIRISDPNSKESFTLERVYDRTVLDDFSDYS